MTTTPEQARQLAAAAKEAASKLDAMMAAAEKEDRQITPGELERVLDESRLFEGQPDYGVAEQLWALLTDYRDALTELAEYLDLRHGGRAERIRLLRAAEEMVQSGTSDRVRLLLEVADRWERIGSAP